MSDEQRARELGHYIVRVSELEGAVRIHIIDPDGSDGRFVNLAPSDGLSIGQKITEIARDLLARKVRKL